MQSEPSSNVYKNYSNLEKNAGLQGASVHQMVLTVNQVVHDELSPQLTEIKFENGYQQSPCRSKDSLYFAKQ